MRKNNTILWVIGVAILLLVANNAGYIDLPSFIISDDGLCDYDVIEGTDYSEIITDNTFRCKHNKCIITAEMTIENPSNVPIDGQDIGDRKVVLRFPEGETGPQYSWIELDSNDNNLLERYIFFDDSGVIACNPSYYNAYRYAYEGLQGEAIYRTNLDTRQSTFGGSIYTWDETLPCDSFGYYIEEYNINPTPNRDCGYGEICVTNQEYSGYFNLCPPLINPIQEYCSGDSSYRSSKISSQTYTLQKEIVLSSGDELTFNPVDGDFNPIINKKLYVKNCKGVGLLVDGIKEEYNWGDNIEVNVVVTLNGEPRENAKVEGVVKNSQGVIVSSVTERTNSMGEITLIFRGVESTGYTDIFLSTTVIEEILSFEKRVYFNDVGLTFKESSESAEQSSGGPIIFFVNVMNLKNQYISPEISSNIIPIISYTGEEILSEEWEYKGNGDYEITLYVTGTGILIGKLSLDWEGRNWESNPYEISVRVPTISIGTSLIEGSALINTENFYQIIFLSNTGERIDPNNIEIEISTPSGIQSEKDFITLEDIIKIETGKYEFNYYFDQLELYTFDILAEKEGFSTGSQRVSVSVGIEPEDDPDAFNFGEFKYLIIIGVIVIFLLIIFSGRKRR